MKGFYKDTLPYISKIVILIVITCEEHPTETADLYNCIQIT